MRLLIAFVFICRALAAENADSSDRDSLGQNLRSEELNMELQQIRVPTPPPTAIPTISPTLRPTGGCAQQRNIPCGNPDRNQFALFRVQQILSANPYTFNARNTNPKRLTAEFVYANKETFKGLIKATDFSLWNKYSMRASGGVNWLTYPGVLSTSVTMAWGNQAGWFGGAKSEISESKAHFELESVRELAPGEGDMLFATKTVQSSSADLPQEKRELGGGCRKLTKAEDGEIVELQGGAAACPPPPPSVFRPEILITYYYSYVPADLGFSSRGASVNSFQTAMLTWKGFLMSQTTQGGDKGYEATFQDKLKSYANTNVGQVEGLTTTRMWISEGAPSNGPPTLQPTIPAGGKGSGLKNSSRMPYFGYIFVVLFLLLALGIIYFFCQKKAKILESKDEVFFTGKKQDEELLKEQAKQQELAMAQMEQQFISSVAPPPTSSPQMARKSYYAEGLPPPGFDGGHGGRRVSATMGHH